MQTAEDWIDKLELAKHPEGGYFRETYRSKVSYQFRKSPVFSGDRSYATSIFYLLRSGECSKLHRIKSDELWFFHAGSPLTVYIFHDIGLASSFTLDPAEGNLHGIVPANTWFGARLHDVRAQDSFALTSCVVSPGFEFNDFTFADPEALIRKFPQHRDLIIELT